jgi:hypothetical protein
MGLNAEGLNMNMGEKRDADLANSAGLTRVFAGNMKLAIA